MSPSKTKSAGPLSVTLVKVFSPVRSKPISKVSPPATSTFTGDGASVRRLWMSAAAHMPVPHARVSPSTPRSYVRMAM